MNKLGHLIVVREAIPKELKFYSGFILLGSILPDLLLHTYMVGHTWKAAKEITMEKMQGFEKWSYKSALCSLYLGYMIHYMEDFFTMPHNAGYTGTLLEHIQYERKLTRYMVLSRKCRNVSEEKIVDENPILGNLNLYMEEMHQNYIEAPQSLETDYSYIKVVSKNIMAYYAVVFEQNKTLYEKEIIEALKLMPQSDTWV